MTPLEWLVMMACILLALGAGAAFFILVIAFKLMREYLEKHR